MQANAENSQEDAKKSEALNIEKLIQAGRAGWANEPRGSGSVLVERATGCVFLSSDKNPIRRPQRVRFQSAIRIDKGKFRNHVGIFEGVVQYMYLDVEGNVTVGIGHLIDDAAAAKILPFHDRQTRLASQSVHIENAFNKVLRHIEKARGGASAFKEITRIDLDLDAIEALFEADVRQTIVELEHEYPNYKTYPGMVQLGMLDLAYNMGARNFASQFQEFKKGLDDRNWAKVAMESRRRETDKKGKFLEQVQNRNNVVQGWFLQAINEEPFYVNADCQPKPLDMMAS